MIIIFNFIGLGILIVAAVLGCALGYLLNAKTAAPLMAMGLVAMGLDLLYRWKVRDGAWFHPRRGGHISFIPVWILGIGMCGSAVVGWNYPMDWRDVRRVAQNDTPALPTGYSTPIAQTSEPLTGLKLNMITGSGPHGLATINGETFGVGETHRLKVAQKTVAVTCLEIHEQAVMASVQGEAGPLELKLGETKSLAMAR